MWVGVFEAAYVLGVFFHEPTGGGEVDIFAVLIVVDDASAFARTVGHDAGVGGGGEHAHGDDFFAEEGVDEGGLAGVEFTEDGHGEGAVEGFDEVLNAGEEGFEARFGGGDALEVGEGGEEIGGAIEGGGLVEGGAQGLKGGVDVGLEGGLEGGGGVGLFGVAKGDQGVGGVAFGEGDGTETVEELGGVVGEVLAGFVEEVSGAGEVVVEESAAAEAEESFAAGIVGGVVVVGAEGDQGFEVVGSEVVFAALELEAAGAEEGLAVVGVAVEGGFVGLEGFVEVIDALVGGAEQGIDGGGGLAIDAAEGAEKELVGRGHLAEVEVGAGAVEEGVEVVGVAGEEAFEGGDSEFGVVAGGFDAAAGEEAGILEEFVGDLLGQREGIVGAAALAKGLGEGDHGAAFVGPDGEGAAKLAGGFGGAVHGEVDAAEAEVEVEFEIGVGLEGEGALEVGEGVVEAGFFFGDQAEEEVAGGVFAQVDRLFEEGLGLGQIIEVEMA